MSCVLLSLGSCFAPYLTVNPGENKYSLTRKAKKFLWSLNVVDFFGMDLCLAYLDSDRVASQLPIEYGTRAGAVDLMSG
jgi:hypothetical protein